MPLITIHYRPKDSALEGSAAAIWIEFLNKGLYLLQEVVAQPFVRKAIDRSKQFKCLESRASLQVIEILIPNRVGLQFPVQLPPENLYQEWFRIKHVPNFGI